MWRHFFHCARQNMNFMIGFVLVFLLLITAIVTEFYTPYDPIKMRISNRMEPPSKNHLLGTDQYGRDVLSRIMQGSQTSILVGVIAVGIGMVFGVTLGVWSGLAGGWWDETIMRLMDVLYAFPAVLNALLLSSLLGPGIRNSMIAIGIYNIPVFARLSRGGVLGAKELDYTAAAYSIGRGRFGVACRHIFPNVLSPLIVQGSVQFAVAILSEAGLSYLGLGTQPPFASWGRMLLEAQTFMGINPLLAVFPGLAIAIAVLGFNLLGDGLRDVLDPKLMKSR